MSCQSLPVRSNKKDINANKPKPVHQHIIPNLLKGIISSQVPFHILNSNCRGKVTRQRLLQVIRIRIGVHPRAERDISLIDGRSINRKWWLGGPDFMTGGLFLVEVLGDDLADGALEVQWTLLHVWVEEAVDEDAGVEVLLCVDAEVLVLGHDALIHVADESEGLVSGVLVAVDFVAHDGLGWADGREALHEEEVWTGGLC